MSITDKIKAVALGIFVAVNVAAKKVEDVRKPQDVQEIWNSFAADADKPKPKKETTWSE